MKNEAVVIGSGLGGLTCALVLARAGMRVTVIEREAQIGGCLQSYRRNGMAYDTGFHYVGGLADGQSLHSIFSYLGLLDLPWQRMDPLFDHITIGDRQFAFAEGYAQFVDTLAAQFPDEREGLEKFTRLLRNMTARQLDLLNPAISADVANSGEYSAESLFEKSAWQYLNETFHDPLLINVLSATSLKMELRRESLPLFTYAHAMDGFIESSWRLRGEGSLIAKTLADGIRAAGGRIVCNAEAEELTERDGRITAVRCKDGSTYGADIFVSSIHPTLTCSLVKESTIIKRIYRNRMARLDNTFGMFTASLLLKPRTLRYLNYNHYVYRNPDVWTFWQNSGSEVGGVLVSCRMPADGSEYARQVDLITPMTWDKCSRWADTKVGRRGEEYTEMKQRMADECIRLAEQAIPGLAAMTESIHTSTPLTWRDYTMTPCGSAYGIRKDCNDLLSTLISPRTPIPNLLLTGQSLLVHGIHGVTMTAMFTCAEILGKEHIWNIIYNKV